LAALAGGLADVSRARGLLLGRLADVGMTLRAEASLAALTDDVVKTSEIEGEHLNVQSVRSSIARHFYTLNAVLAKARFWQRFAGKPMNERQVKLLNRLLDGFEGKLTTSKWASIAQCSPDTALRDIAELVSSGALTKSAAGGRRTSYELPDLS
jgi:Fic family protein